MLVDGEQLAVGIRARPVRHPRRPFRAGPARPDGPGRPGSVDLNTAGPEQLDTLPGVGPVLAQAIVTWRTDHGRFSSIGDLQQVNGIGPAKFAEIKALVTV